MVADLKNESLRPQMLYRSRRRLPMQTTIRQTMPMSVPQGPVEPGGRTMRTTEATATTMAAPNSTHQKVRPGPDRGASEEAMRHRRTRHQRVPGPSDISAPSREAPTVRGDPRASGLTPWRIRIGDYRVIYDVRDDVLTVTVVRAAHRREVYDR